MPKGAAQSAGKELTGPPESPRAVGGIERGRLLRDGSHREQARQAIPARLAEDPFVFVENGAMAFDPDELRPLFRLGVGIPGSSQAIKKGELVYVPRYRRRCKVLKNDRKKKLLAVEVGALRMELPWEDVSWVQPLDTD